MEPETEAPADERTSAETQLRLGAGIQELPWAPVLLLGADKFLLELCNSSFKQSKNVLGSCSQPLLHQRPEKLNFGHLTVFSTSACFH